MTISIISDSKHYSRFNELKQHLTELGMTVKDYGSSKESYNKFLNELNESKPDLGIIMDDEFDISNYDIENVVDRLVIIDSLSDFTNIFQTV